MMLSEATNGSMHLPVSCPGCNKTLHLETAQESDSDSWRTRAKLVNWQGHECPELGPMPDPMDSAELLKWIAGAYRDVVSYAHKKSSSSLTIVSDNSTVAQSVGMGNSAEPVVTQKSERKPRRHVHVPYDLIECPAVEDCHVKGRVPGVRRHVGFMHPELVDSTVFPPNRTKDGLIDNFESDELAAESLIDALGIRKDLPNNASWEDVAEQVLKIVGDK